MLTTILTLLLSAATAFPSASQTGWMRPESFRLTIGMSRADAVRTLSDGGWQVKQGKKADEMLVDYTDERALTLEFQKERLKSVRFELFSFLPEVRKAFAEEKQFLTKTLGQPKKGTKSVLIYDDRLPNVIVVLSDDPKSENGQKGVGFMAVRYFDPR
ncbi:MAG TPA: hypothetical protein VF618_06600 [Thermoanaerobaculia bacterium]